LTFRNVSGRVVWQSLPARDLLGPYRRWCGERWWP